MKQHTLMVTIVIYAGFALAAPERTLHAMTNGLELLSSVAVLLCAIFGLVGLLNSWVDRDQISRRLGEDAGLRGLLLALVCGMLLIGPPFVIFPLLMNLRRHGARWAVVATLLFAYALKPQLLPIEAGFLGTRFALMRALLTLALAIPLGLMVERLMGDKDSHCAQRL